MIARLVTPIQSFQKYCESCQDKIATILNLVSSLKKTYYGRISVHQPIHTKPESLHCIFFCGSVSLFVVLSWTTLLLAGVVCSDGHTCTRFTFTTQIYHYRQAKSDPYDEGNIWPILPEHSWICSVTQQVSTVDTLFLNHGFHTQSKNTYQVFDFSEDRKGTSWCHPWSAVYFCAKTRIIFLSCCLMLFLKTDL